MSKFKSDDQNKYYQNIGAGLTWFIDNSGNKRKTKKELKELFDVTAKTFRAYLKGTSKIESYMLEQAAKYFQVKQSFFHYKGNQLNETIK